MAHIDVKLMVKYSHNQVFALLVTLQDPSQIWSSSAVGASQTVKKI